MIRFRVSWEELCFTLFNLRKFSIYSRFHKPYRLDLLNVSLNSNANHLFNLPRYPIFHSPLHCPTTDVRCLDFDYDDDDDDDDNNNNNNDSDNGKFYSDRTRKKPPLKNCIETSLKPSDVLVMRFLELILVLQTSAHSANSKKRKMDKWVEEDYTMEEQDWRTKFAFI